MRITVYSKPACSQCNMTKYKLDKLKLDYEVIDVTEDENAFQHIKDLGYLQVPVVQIGNDGRHWSGFRPDLLDELVK